MAANPAATGIPKEGIDVFLSDQLVVKVKDAITKNCKDTIDTKCQQSVQTVLQSKDVNLEARQLGPIAILAAGVTLFIGIVTPYLFAHDKKIPVPIHIGPAELSQISSIGTKTEIHVATATSGGSILTVTQAPKPTTAAGYVNLDIFLMKALHPPLSPEYAATHSMLPLTPIPPHQTILGPTFFKIASSSKILR